MNQTFRKMYTPEEIKAIAGGGGAGLEVIEITDVPSTATSGILNEAQMVIVNSDSPSCIKFNNEYYYKNDDNHTEGLIVYSHTGYTKTDGGSTIKYISITTATSAWTLTSQNVSGKLYLHTITWRIPVTFNNTQIDWITIQIICSSATALTLNQYKNLGSGIEIPVIIRSKTKTDNITSIITNISMGWYKTNFIVHYNYYNTSTPTSILYNQEVLDNIYDITVTPL